MWHNDKHNVFSSANMNRVKKLMMVRHVARVWSCKISSVFYLEYMKGRHQFGDKGKEVRTVWIQDKYA
jgi:hypothetical protein